MNILLALVIAYLLGAIPFGYILVKLTTGGDVRTSGSGTSSAVVRSWSSAVGGRSGLVVRSDEAGELDPGPSARRAQPDDLRA